MAGGVTGGGAQLLKALPSPSSREAQSCLLFLPCHGFTSAACNNMFTDVLSTFELVQDVVQHVTDAETALRNITESLKTNSTNGLHRIDCRELELRLKVDVEKVVQWEELWHIESSRSETFLLAVWGQGGRDTIKGILRRILTVTGKVEASLKNATELTQNITRSFGDRRQSWFRMLASFLGFGVKSAAGKAAEQQIQSLVKDLSDSIDDLWSSSERCFRSLHGFRANSRHHDITDYTSVILNRALESRSMSVILYFYCHSWEGALWLDLSLLNNDREFDKVPDLYDWLDLEPRYRLLGITPSDGDSAREIVFEACLASDLKHGDDPEGTYCELKTLEEIVHQNVLEKEVRLRVSENELGATFRVSSGDFGPLNTLELNHLPVFSGQASETMPQKWTGRLSPHETLSLAYQIAEFGLYLLGTPWMAYLNWDNLRRVKPLSRDFQYVVLLKDRTASTSKLETGSVLLERSQIFQIGVLLVQIATGNSTKSDDFGSHFELDWLTGVEYSLGMGYRQACQFCLECRDNDIHMEESSTSGSQMTDRPDFDSKYLLQLYYSEVFLRSVKASLYPTHSLR